MSDATVSRVIVKMNVTLSLSASSPYSTCTGSAMSSLEQVSAAPRSMMFVIVQCRCQTIHYYSELLAHCYSSPFATYYSKPMDALLARQSAFVSSLIITLKNTLLARRRLFSSSLPTAVGPLIFPTQSGRRFGLRLLRHSHERPRNLIRRHK